ncbi:bifunctional heptose 7-phosphate kinase/heptose 1-phosphate adenyltransferase [Oxynema aestuarii]|uniref:D-glycero-beta-D-manno-heptose-7-phosphate kinase n=1 Tax=Oxynema aestuarii AP17 TaxID=2064643 RepID=A0A6H1TVQ4_9CYAN|nr:PfkB family carbohydrate kinase [Oxynema aestuarii]QIZ70020.1 D-glycero-beta-D-manno-heptose-7-phosphate kinase [Oxynema aestuarii AP17]
MTLDSPFIAQLHRSATRLSDRLQQFSRVRVLVVGDLTLDEFLTGQVERISREAPVPIVRHENTRQVPGGGANAVYNLAKLGAQVKVAGLVGEDEPGRALLNIFEGVGIDTSGILRDRDRPTVTKTRISAHSRQSVTQQIVRIDRKSDALPHPDLQARLADYIRQQHSAVDAILCSDYGDGVLTSRTIEATLKHPLTVVDTQKHLDRYRGASLFTPNLPEAEQALGYKIDTLATLERAGGDLLDLTQADYILITRGEQGMSIFDRAGTIAHIPAFNRTDVFDVTGAGDTVVAVLTLGLAIGATPWEAAVLGNLAASLVVRQFGTATTTIAQMQEALFEFIHGDSTNPS